MLDIRTKNCNYFAIVRCVKINWFLKMVIFCVDVISFVTFQHLLDERAFRLQRAMQCSVQKTVLPKDQWPTYEEDREKGRYLTPYLDEVVRERKEKEEWSKMA